MTLQRDNAIRCDCTARAVAQCTGPRRGFHDSVDISLLARRFLDSFPVESLVSLGPGCYACLRPQALLQRPGLHITCSRHTFPGGGTALDVHRESSRPSSERRCGPSHTCLPFDAFAPCRPAAACTPPSTMSVDPRRRPASTQPPPPPPPPPTSAMEDPRPATTVAADPVPSRPATATATPQATPPNPPTEQQGGFKLKFCTVCASNNNRSMEAHLRLTTAPSGAYPTISFGTGSLVRLPGPSITQPNVYHFNSTSYSAMYEELAAKDPRLYRANGILPMLERNRNVKWGPERWQDWRVGVPRVGKRNGDGDAEYRSDKGYTGTEAGTVDIVITCEERCWDAVVDDLLTRGSPLNRPVHVFNVDIKDNHEEALVGGKAILELADELNAAAREERERSGDRAGFEQGRAGARMGFDERVPGILAAWQERWPGLPALWTLAWF